MLNPFSYCGTGIRHYLITLTSTFYEKNTHTSGPFVKLWTEPFAKLQRRLILRLKKTLRCSTNRFFSDFSALWGNVPTWTYIFPHKNAPFFHSFVWSNLFLRQNLLTSYNVLRFCKKFGGKRIWNFHLYYETRGILKQLGFYKSIFQVGQIAKKCLRR